MHSVIYYGNSMRRVFKFGEHLELEKVGFDDLQPGDIIVVAPPGKNQYVHRIIKKDALQAVTMGDNNAAADDYPVTAQSDFSLVTGVVNADGTVRRVTRGSAGLREFRRHRLRRKIRQWGRKVLFCLGKFFFWRRTLREKKIFNQEVCYYWKNRAVARQTASGKVTYAHWCDFLRFKVPEISEK